MSGGMRRRGRSERLAPPPLYARRHRKERTTGAEAKTDCRIHSRDERQTCNAIIIKKLCHVTGVSNNWTPDDVRVTDSDSQSAFCKLHSGCDGGGASTCGLALGPILEIHWRPRARPRISVSREAENLEGGSYSCYFRFFSCRRFTAACRVFAASFESRYV